MRTSSGEKDIVHSLIDEVEALKERLASLERLIQPPVTAIVPDCLYRVPAVAKILDCSVTNLYLLVNQQQIAVTRIGAGNSGVRIRGNDIIQFLECRRSGGPAAVLARRPGSRGRVLSY